MDIAKTIFKAIDKVFDKRFNNSIHIEDSEKVELLSNISYSSTNPEICMLDCYHIPKYTKRKSPVILYIHGGGFVAGDKDCRKALCTWLATQGYFVVNVNYGLCPECHFPEPIIHLVEALNWIYENAKEHKLDLTRLIAAGDSAGAYYASMLATICTNKTLQNIFNVKPKAKFGACVLNSGIYDLNKALKEKLPFDLNIKIFESYAGIGMADFEKYELARYCSPLAFMNKRFPPTFLIYAKKDIICKGQHEFILNKLEQLDTYFESYNSTSLLKNHCFSLEWTSKEAQRANELLADFLKRFAKRKLPKRQSKADVCIREEEI